MRRFNYPNDPKDPSVPGNFGTVTIPHVDGFVPSYNGVELTPVDPTDPSKDIKYQKTSNQVIILVKLQFNMYLEFKKLQ